MKVKNFVEGYLVANDQRKYVFSHIENKYILYEAKMQYCINVLNASCKKKDEEGNIIGIEINTPMRQEIYLLTLVDLYTDIEFDYKDGLQVFNALNQYNLVNFIVSNIPKTEKKEFDNMMTMCYEDMLENERSFAGWIDRKLDNLGILSDILANNDKIQDLITAKVGETNETEENQSDV